MNRILLIFLLLLCLLLLFLLLFQYFHFLRPTDKAIRQMAAKMEEILDTRSEEKLMLFTGHPGLIALSAQINRLLVQDQKICADVERSRISSRKMLSNISHDLKTPLTVLLGYLEMLQMKTENELAVKARCQAEKMMELIGQFFTLARLESGDYPLELTIQNVCSCCRDTLVDYYQLLTEQGFQVEPDIPEEPLSVYGNREAIRRILDNLISNAVRYGKDGKYLGLSVLCQREAVMVQVTDHGKGIDPARSQIIFDRLFTAEDSRSRDIWGSGLGLSIARRLARQMGGDLTVDSRPGISTTFTLSLPRKDFVRFGQEI